MRAFASISLLLCSGCFALAQKAPALEPAQALDVRVEEVQWHPKGDALIYKRQEDEGFGLGFYRFGDAEGKVLVHLKKGDQYDLQWFDGSTNALVTVHKQVVTPQGKANEADVYYIDSKQRSAYEVFSKIVPAPDDISIEVDASPLLNHAILTIHEGKTTYHAVLPSNGSKVVASSDIDAAIAQGFSGPSWSKDGTAIFSNGAGQIEFTGPVKVTGSSTGAATGVSKTLEFEFKVATSVQIADGDKIMLRLVPPTPPIGTPVLEVVPGNGTLRQVRSPGPWIEPKQPATTLASQSHPVWVDYGRLRGSANSLWLMTGPKENPAGVLVAPHANEATIAPEDKAVAYIIDGALFVRRIGKQ